MPREIPTPPDSNLLNAIRFGSGTLRFVEGMQARFDEITAVPIPGRAPVVVVTDPALVHDALGRPAEFRRIPASGTAAMVSEQGLVQSEGDLWRQQRSVMGSAFADEGVEAYANAVGERTAQLVDEWDRATGERLNLHREMTALTLRSASEVLFGSDIGPDRAGRFHGWMQAAAREFEFSPTSVGPDWLPSRPSREFRTAAAGIKAFAEDLIERRRDALAADGGSAAGDSGGTAGGGGAGTGDSDDSVARPGDVLGLLLSAADDPSVDLPPQQIRDEVVTLLIAGHETTALGLTYASALLSWHPEARERVRAEARAVLGDDRPRHEHAADLEYTRRVFRETLRLYPPAWAVFREASAEVRLGDYRVKEGSTLLFPQWSIHRDGRYFEAPGEFDPDRWERRDPDTVGAYFPFGSGPHACIGSRFSLTGAPLALAGLVRSFDVDVPTGALDAFCVTPTLRPRDGVTATVRRVADTDAGGGNTS